MPIPETQLDIWAKPGSVAQSKSTYATIRNALDALDAAYHNRSYDIFLQGSYGNDTNVYADSDVDVVIQLQSTVYNDLTELDAASTAAFNASSSTADYQIADFKSDVLTQLRKKFPGDVNAGNKAILVDQNGARRSADVLVAATFHRYYAYSGPNDLRRSESPFENGIAVSFAP